MRTIIFTLAILLFSLNGMAQNTRGVDDAKGLAVGVKAPLFKAIDADSNEFDLAGALKTGSVVLIFYRGAWCPICNKHLGQVQDSLKLITQRGATVIADNYDVNFTPEKNNCMYTTSC